MLLLEALMPSVCRTLVFPDVSAHEGRQLKMPNLPHVWELTHTLRLDAAFAAETDMFSGERVQLQPHVPS